jgi:flagellar protein FlbD
MIHLTRLNNQPFIVNADLIKFIENSPDTVITLLTGEKLVVLESADEVLKRIGEFHERFYRRAGPGIVFDTSLPGGTSGGAEAVTPPEDAPRGKESLRPHPRPRDEKS